MHEKLPICDITPFTMQDFPEHTSCILWFGGCNMRCLYCHNPELILGKKKRLQTDKVWKFLKSRKNLLDGVVLSGGECTLVSALPDFIKEVKKLGLKVKLDTNGSNPFMLKSMLEDEIIDYVALDYKSPRSKFYKITKFDIFDVFHTSLEILCDAKIPYEVRTTVHTDLLDIDDIKEIVDDLESCGFKGKYFVQNYNDSETLYKLYPQKQKLDISHLPKSKYFNLETRNFY